MMIGNLTRKELAIAFREAARGNPHGVSTIVEFLRRDPWVMGSGYAKEAAWKLLKRVELTDGERAKVLDVARQYLERRIGREFRDMALYVRRIATPEFRSEIEALARNPNDAVGQRAELLATYLRDPQAGRELQRTYWDRARSAR